MSMSLYGRLARRYGGSDAVSRREMLRASLAVGAGLLLSNRSFARVPGNAGKRVVVIGAGFAGLACAHELLAAGYDVTVIEARNRVGGRVLTFTDMAQGKTAEGGGELIGSNHPTWVAYAEKFGLTFRDVTEDEDLEAPIMLQGRKLSAEESEKLWEEMEAANSTMNADAETVNADEPWKTPKAAEWDRRPTSDWVEKLDVSPLCRRAIATELTANNGVDVSKQSYLANLTQVKGGGVEKYWTDSEVYRCAQGNQQLAFKLAEKIGSDRIVLKLPVTHVKVSGDRVDVKCADGRTLEVDQVVLACPPTVWKKISFSPEIPSILMPQMGTNIKYLSSLKTRFWKEKGLSPDSMTDGDVSMTWECTNNQEGDDQVVVSGFSGGPPAENCRAYSREERDAKYKANFEKIYPGFSENWTGARFMDWPGDPWALAGYSFPAPGELTKLGPLWLKGLPRIHFAGEHTCYKFIGYMEGGLNSGATLAKRIVERAGVPG